MTSKRFCAVAMLLIVALFIIPGCKERKYAYTSVFSDAMMPTIAQGTVVQIDFNAYKQGKKVKRWDVIGIKMRRTITIKRVVGLPGETLELKPAGRFIEINGKDVKIPDYVPWHDQKLLKSPTDYPVIGSSVQIPQGHIFVMDDNIGVTDDSRMFGFVPVKLVTGKVVLDDPKKPTDQAS